MATSSSSPCAACKFLRRKCTAECVFAPYFPPDQPQKFANVHKVFGASNITKLLNELPPHKREDAVNSLAYEADARIKDPVYGCVGAISILQRQVAQLQQELAIAQSDLARLSSSSPTAMPLAIASPSSASTIGGVSAASSLAHHHHHHGHHHHHHLSTMGLSPPSPTTLLAQPASITQQQHMLMMHNRYHARDAVQQLLDQLQRDTLLTRDQLIDQLTRVGGGSLEAGLAALGNMSFIPRSSSDGGSGSSGGNMGHLSPP